MNLKLSILRVLNLCHPLMMPVPSLRSEVETQQRARVGDTDFASALKALQSKGMIDYEIDALTGDTRYRITSLGTAYLNP